MTHGGLFPAEETSPSPSTQPLRAVAGLFGDNAAAEPSDRDAITKLFPDAEPATDAFLEDDLASPPPAAVGRSYGNALGLPRRQRTTRLIGIATAALVIAALGAATLFFVTRPPTDALEPLRNLERTIYSDERNLERIRSAAAADLDAAAAAAEQAVTAADAVRGLIPDADADALGSAARGVTSATTAWSALTVPDPYSREIAQDADGAAVAAAVRTAEKAQRALESALASAQSAQSVLSLRLDALDLAADRVTASLLTAADTALAKETPVVDETFRTDVTGPLEQLRPFAGSGAELLSYVPMLADPVRALTSEQARLEAEEAERQRLLQEQRERERNRVVPTTPAQPTDPAPVEPPPSTPTPAPSEPTPVDPTPVDPTPVDPTDAAST